MAGKPVPGTPQAVLAAVLVVPVVVGLVLIAFVWPTARLAPRDLPVGVAGPAADVVTERLATAGGDAFEVHTYADEADARDAVERREVYGAIVTGPAGVKVLTASAASPVVAQQLVQVVSAAMASGDAATNVTPGPTVLDVVAAPAADPRGAALGSAVLPLVLAGMVVGLVLTTVSRPGPEQVGALVVTSGLVGVVATAISHSWLEVVAGPWWGVAGVLALMVLAISTAVAGLRGLLGKPGVVVVGVLVVLLGNPWSGFSSAPELLPGWVSAVGGVLPPGAGGSLLRDVAFFDGNGGVRPAFVLFGWFVLGAGGVLAANLRGMPADAPEWSDGFEGFDGFRGFDWIAARTGAGAGTDADGVAGGLSPEGLELVDGDAARVATVPPETVSAETVSAETMSAEIGATRP